MQRTRRQSILTVPAMNNSVARISQRIAQVGDMPSPKHCTKPGLFTVEFYLTAIAGAIDHGSRFIQWIHSVNLSHCPASVVEQILREVPDVIASQPLRPVGGTTEVELQAFIQRLALLLTSWQATTFLVGEYVEGEIRDNPVFTRFPMASFGFTRLRSEVP